jgi:hypothetical protein
MILKDAIKKTEETKTYKDWAKKNKDYCLVHAFTMLDEQDKKYNWQLGYYSKEKDKLVVIETEPEIKIGSEEDVFKKEGVVNQLDFKKVKVSVQKAMTICDELLQKKYSAQTITKRIILLQKIEKEIYNLTLVTRAFGIINIKIDAVTGEVISDNIQSIMGLGKWEKGEGKKEAA